ncbi:MAG: 4-hydroxy-3-methylbut-2-enyl diphosphate reductase [Alphaproteobacteria bacterium]|nr:MAG: 4-hydroxy-3-methylbut-2-enyl diphosphate reductase [Alphaproteobacteria bacterium]
MTTPKQASLNIYLAAPRGFCAGVDRAIKIVEKTLQKYGAPVFVRHEIVHNRHVVESLEQKGAVFVNEVSDAPHDRPIIFSAHGVAKSVPAEAKTRQMIYVDATCPLVTKVHSSVNHLHDEGYHIVLIGHEGHPEVIGTMGQLPEGSIDLIENIEDAKNIDLSRAEKLAYVTQTTLSVDDTTEIVKILAARFPHIRVPKKDDICYATTNRQEAVKAMAEKCDAIIVIGAPNSSNSVRLVEVAEKAGCPKAMLLQSARDMDWNWLQGVVNLGITAGASAPEILVEELIDACRARFTVTTQNITTAEENIEFKLPKILMDDHDQLNPRT